VGHHVVLGQWQRPTFAIPNVTALQRTEKKPDRQRRPLQETGLQFAQCQRTGVNPGAGVDASREETVEVESIGMYKFLFNRHLNSFQTG
jgi:hypothetical protein